MEHNVEFVIPEEKKDAFEKIKQFIADGKNVVVTGYTGSGKCSSVRKIIEHSKHTLVPSTYFNLHRYFSDNALQTFLDAEATGKDIVYFEEADVLGKENQLIMLRYIQTTNKQVLLTWDTSHLPSASPELLELVEVVSFD